MFTKTENEKYKAEDFIKDSEIRKIISESEKLANDSDLVDSILEKARKAEGLSPEEAAVLLSIKDEKNIK